MLRRLVLIALIAATAWTQPAKSLVNEQWTRPFPPFRIVGNVYYVGTYDLACYLIVTPQGDILINTGVQGSGAQIQSNIQTLGFKSTDVKLLMTTQAHFDHVTDMAAIKRLTGAKMLATAPDAPLLESGGKTDFRFGADPGAWFPAVKVDQKLTDGQKVSLGGFDLTVHVHPGHTKGSASYSFPVTDGGKTYQVLIANLGSINPGVTLLKNPKYPNIAQDYAHTFASQKELHPDIFLASHAGQFRMHEKYKPGDAYQPERFVDPEGFQSEVRRLEKVYLEQLERERSAR